MSGFAPDWLRLREPLDAAARAMHDLATHLAPAPPTGSRVIVDLGSGTGANLRYLAPRLAGPQSWQLLDHDARLLEATRQAVAAWAEARGARCAGAGETLTVAGPALTCRIRLRRIDLAHELALAELPAKCLVTASALLDLVGEAWLQALADRCRAADAGVLFALSYDGRIVLSPADAEDAWVRELVNRHQRRDKGFGDALGPAAADTAERIFSAAGYRIERATSDWRLAPAQHREQRALLTGWHAAGRETEPSAAERLDAWLARRAAHLERGESRMRVGHVDLIGMPLG